MSKRHAVRLGECVSSVSFDNGFFPDTIWNHPENAGLKSLRGDMNILNAGDSLFIPDKRDKQESGETGRTHRFRLRGVPAKFLMQLRDGDQLRVGVSYTLKIDERMYKGVTGDDGMIEHWIPPNARRGLLSVENGDDVEEYPFQLGCLQPVALDDGLRDRLQNLGFLPGGAQATPGEVEIAIRAFRRKHMGATPGGPDDLSTADDAFRAKLVEVHGS
ncbi:MAG: hypothetical protein U1D55_09475 [Phycisphaerae bacterium]